MFALLNPTTFKYYLPFLVFYIILVVFPFVFRFILKNTSKDVRRLYKKSFGYFAESCIWVGLLGLVYLGARRYSVYFFSMEFLHIINLAILALFFGFGLKKYLKLKK
jgi:hypothetical protein